MKKLCAAICMMASVGHAVSAEISRDELLSSDRLDIISAETIQNAEAEKTEQLKQQLLNVKDNQTISIAPGKYANLGEITIAANNVTIKAETPGTAWLTGLVQLRVTGDNVVLDGLVFTEGGPAERFGGVRLMGDRNTLQNSTFHYFNHDYEYEPDERRQEYPRYLWLSMWGTNALVINNRFEGKQKRGTLIGVQANEHADNHVIKHNIFVDQKPNQYNEFDIAEAIRYNGNSWEAIRLGDSKSSQWPSESEIVENLMIDMDGERELISIKSGNNLIQGNTIFNSASMISLRHGKANIVEDNVILGNGKRLTGGVRVYDEDHVIRNNYIANTRGRDGLIEGNADLRGAVVINTGIIDVANDEILSEETKGKELNKQWTPKNITIANNTVVDAQWGMVHGNQTHRASLFDNTVVDTTFTGTDIRFQNNLVKNLTNENVGVRANEEMPLINASYENEVYSGKIVGAAEIANYTTKLPETSRKSGFVSAGGVGADVFRLKILTADTVGPDYALN